MVEQNVRAALTVADRGCVLDGGENRFEGDAASIRDRAGAIPHLGK